MELDASFILWEVWLSNKRIFMHYPLMMGSFPLLSRQENVLVIIDRISYLYYSNNRKQESWKVFDNGIF